MLPETIETFKQIYSEKKEIIDYMEKFGNNFEKMEAVIIKKAALDF
ncbi:hypothetical protein [Methanosarcina siciliae]|nr:hypothetical protein [Methanosarcina siciliae]